MERNGEMVRFPVVSTRIPRRLSERPTSARDWYTMLIELGQRVTDDIHAENVYLWLAR